MVDGWKGRPVPIPLTQWAEMQALPVGTDKYGSAGAAHQEVPWCK